MEKMKRKIHYQEWPACSIFWKHLNVVCYSRLLCQHEVRAHHDIAISWIKAHTGGFSPEALGNAAADLLAARGRSGSSSAVVRPPVRPRRSRRLRSSSPSDLLRREVRVRLRDPRLLPATRYLSPLHRAAVLRLAATCRDRPRPLPVPPVAFGDVVGD